MAQNTALSAGDQTALSGPSTRRTYLSVVPSTSIATARINAPSGLTWPLASLPVDATSADWLNIRAGQTVLIGTAAGLGDVAVLRVRVAPSGTSALDVMEVGQGDAGALTADLRPSGIADNQYVTVLQRYDLWTVLPRIVYSGGTSGDIYEDYDATVGTANSQPAPIVNCTINGRAGHFATRVADSATQAISAVVTVTHWPTSSSATYQWYYPASFTSVSGATTATLTATAPIGLHEIRCVITPNVGGTTEIVRRVHVHDTTTTPPIYLPRVTSDSRDRTGRRIGITLNDNALASIPNGAMCILFDMCTWNGSDVASATTTFSGWLIRDRWSAQSRLRTAEAEIVGPAGVLALLGGASQYFEQSNSTDTWQKVLPTLCTVPFIVWWLMRYRAGNLLKLFDLNLPSTASSAGRMPAFNIPKGSILSQLQQVGRRYYASNFGADSAGSFFLSRHPSLIPVADRASDVVTRDNALTAAKYASANIDHAPRPTTRTVYGEAFSWDGGAALPTAYRSEAPDKPGQGASEITLTELVVDQDAAQTDLNTLTGLAYAQSNNPYPSISVRIPANRDVYEPAHMQFVTVTLPANLSPMGAALTVNAVPVSVSKRYGDNGATDIDLVLEAETSGADGLTRPVPVGENTIDGDVDVTIPDISIPEIDIDWGGDVVYDPDTTVVIGDKPGATADYGRLILATSDGYAARVTWPSGTLTFTDISPTSAQRTALGTAFKLERDRRNYKRYLLVGQYAVLACNDVTATSPKWTTLHSIPALGTWSQSVDFTTDNGGFSVTGGGALGSAGTYTPGVGWVAGDGGADGGGIYRRNVDIKRTISSATITEYSMIYDLTKGSYSSAAAEAALLADSGSFPRQSLLHGSASSGTNLTYTYTGSLSGITYLQFRVTSSFQASATYSGSALIKSLSITGSGTNPFTGTGTNGHQYGFDFQTHAKRSGLYYWLSTITESGTPYLYFFRTLNGFSSIQSTKITTYASTTITSMAVNPFNHREIYVTVSGKVWRSLDGGASFTATSTTINTNGGPLHWNYSTQNPNTKNTSTSNLLIVTGSNGSNIQVQRGLSGTPVTLISGTTGYPESPYALTALSKDLDFVRYAARTGTIRLSSDAAATWANSAASITGGSSFIPRNVAMWPTGSAFALVSGYRCLTYTADTGANWTNIWSSYDTFRSSTFGASNGETIIGAYPDISQRYTIPVE